MKNQTNTPPAPPQKFSLFQKIVYTLFGYPPRPQPLSDDVWDKWKARYDAEDYDFSKHSGKTGKHV
jgi:hypothetical protein